ncbi:unnamed protein product [Lactuca saligna]|uniref:Uncharacterized protein n=1 Tax=Lactuca saligna TaxID=75948 RepID=A0AA35Z6Z6_LACSI|nr:unnamed protein product [Lactuca saligna]
MSSLPPTHTSSTIPPASVAFFLIESEERSCRSPSSPIESGILRRVDGPRRLKTAVSYARPASTFVENILFSVHVLFIVPGFASIFICYLNLGLLSHPLLSLPVAEYNSFFVADSERLEGGHWCLISSARGGIGYGRRHSLVRIGESIRMGFI